MTGRILRSAVACGLSVGFCLCEPLHAGQNSQTDEPQQNQTQEEGLEALRAAAEQGDAEAQSTLGLIYSGGEGVPQDYVEALRWLRLAAEQGDVRAQFSLGFMFSEGEGVPQDEAEGVRWYRSSRGRARGRGGSVGPRKYVFGRPGCPAECDRGGPVVSPRGRAKGRGRAQRTLGLLLATGEGVPQDTAEAARWYRLAAEQGDAFAQFNLD